MAVNKVVYDGNTLIDLSGDTLVNANQLLDGVIAHSKDGCAIVGTMPNNGEVGGTIDGLTIISKAIPAGYTSGGTVSLTNDIEAALAAI